MASSGINCGVCALRGISKPPVIWCSECDEGLCTDCREHHGLSKGTRHHNTMPITEYQKLPSNILKITQFCSKHDEKYQTYCMKHGCPCCRRCVIESHNDCKDLHAIDDIVHDVKTSNAFLEVEQRLAEIAENIQKIRKDREENIVSLKEQRVTIEKEIYQYRTKVNAHLDKIQAELMNDLAFKEEKESDKIGQYLTALKKKENEITEFQATITNIKQHASDLQAFLALKQLEIDVNNKEEYLQSVTKGENLNLVLLSCKIEALIQNFESSSLNFGEVSVESKPAKLTITRQKERQAQIFVPKSSSTSFENITINLQQEIKTSGTVIGCIILPDGRMMFSCDVDKCVNQKTKIEEEINQARKKINEHLDSIQAELINELASKEVDETEKIVQLMTVLKKKEKEIKECQATMTNIKQHASDLQAFLALKQLETDVDDKEEFLQLVTKGENLNQIVLFWKNEALSTLPKFGEVSMESNPAKLTITRQKERQAQIFVPKSSSTSIENITVNPQQKINTSEYITGCIILPDGRMMFACYYDRCVRCIGIDGRQDFEIKLNTYSSDITYIEHDNTVAVSSGSGKSINIIDIQSKKVNNVIKVDSYCGGITYKDGKIIFTTGNKGIRMLNLKDKSINDIITRKLDMFSYVTTFGDNIYFTDQSKHTVTCCDISGTMKWEFKDDTVLKEPLGITVDNNSLVYVVCYKSKNLVLISSDGKQCRELLNQKDGLDDPWSVHYQRDTSKLLIANITDTAFLYNVK